MPRLLLAEPQALAQMPSSNPNVYGAQIGAQMQETGRLTQALGQVLNEYADSQSRTAAIRYEQDLKAGADEISRDPDIAGRSQKLDDLANKLRSAYTPKLGNRNEYESRVGFATNDVRLSLMSKTKDDATAEIRLGAEQEATFRVQQAAATGDDQEIGIALVEAQNAFDDARLAYTPNQRMAAFQKVAGEGIRTLADTNPKIALKYIDQIGPMLGPEVQAVYREEAMTNIRQAAAAQVAEDDRLYKLNERAEKERSEQAETDLVQLDAAGSLTAGEVNRQIQSGALSPAAGRRWLAHVRKGPDGAGGGSLDRDLYVRLSEAADRGESITDEVNQAYLDLKIGKPEHDALVGRRSDVVFKEPRKAILGALDPKAYGMQAEKMRMPELRADAVLAYDRWVRSNPDASIEQAEEKAQELIKAKLSTGKRNKTAKSLAFTSGLGNGKRIETQEDVDAAAVGLRKKLESGGMKQDQYDAEMLKLDDLAQSIEADAKMGGTE